MPDPIEISSPGATRDLRGRPEALILVSVAPTSPYPELFASGPAATWALSSVDRVVVKTYSGQSIPPFRRPFADIREMLRFPGAHPSKVGTVSANSLSLRAYGAATDVLVKAGRADASAVTRYAGRVAHRGLLLASRGVQAWERSTIPGNRRHRRVPVFESNGHLTVDRTATVSNSLAIQLDIFTHLAASPQIAGVLFVTASAFVDQVRFLQWVDGPGRDVFVAGANALTVRTDGESPLVFFSGFCQYFSWRAITELAGARDFDVDVPNDVALTKWLLEHGVPWEDPGIVWSTTVLETGRCPLCEDASKFVVRCTSHEARDREGQFMAQLNHAHNLSA